MPITEVLDPSFNELVLAMAAKIDWYAVGYEPYLAFEEMKYRFNSTGMLLVSSANSEGTIFGDPHVNHAFRAWHDYCHIIMGAPFTLEGERIAADEQEAQMRYHLTGDAYGRNPQVEWFSRIIDCEVNGQARYYFETGSFPTDQLAFARRYLSDNRGNPLPHPKLVRGGIAL